MIAIVDYGVGNVRSVERALVHVGAEPKLTADPDELERADGLVLPGVGAFAPALAKLSDHGLGRRIVELCPLAVDALRRHRVQQAETRLRAPEWPRPDLVFPNYSGRPLRGPNVNGEDLPRLLDLFRGDAGMGRECNEGALVA